MPVASISEIPADATGSIILCAQLYAAPGQASRLAGILSDIQKTATSDEEPGCLEYRPIRSFVTEGVIKFVVWEVYKDPAALTTHFGTKAFAGLAAAIEAGGLLAQPPAIEYFYELK